MDCDWLIHIVMNSSAGTFLALSFSRNKLLFNDACHYSFLIMIRQSWSCMSAAEPPPKIESRLKDCTFANCCCRGMDFDAPNCSSQSRRIRKIFYKKKQCSYLKEKKRKIEKTASLESINLILCEITVKNAKCLDWLNWTSKSWKRNDRLIEHWFVTRSHRLESKKKIENRCC